MLPLGQGLLCFTADQQFLIYVLVEVERTEDGLNLVLRKRLIGYNEEIADMKFLGGEQFFAVATTVEQIRVYDLASMSCSYVLAGHTDVVLCLDTCVSSPRRTLIVTGSKNNSVRLWESQSRYCIGVGIGHLGAIGAVAFSKNNRNFFVCTSRIVLLANGGSRIWFLWLYLKGRKRGIWSVEFSLVDQCVITASGDKTIKLLAISDGSCLKTFEGHTSSVIRASFITHGTQFVSCGADSLVKLWTVKTNECMATQSQHEDKIWALAIGKKTQMLATGGGDAVINLSHDSTTADK